MAIETVEKIPFSTELNRKFTPEEWTAEKAKTETPPGDKKESQKIEEKKEEVKAETKSETKTEEKKEEVKTEEVKVTKKEAEEHNTTKKEIEEFFKSDLAEKYGINTKEELFEILDRTDELAEELTKREGKPKFKSAKQEELYNFLQDYDDIAEGVEVAARLQKMDPEKMNGRKAMEEAYVLENRDMPREKALKLFEREFREKYESLKEDEFEDKAAYKEEKEILELKKEREEIKARKTLLSHKEKLKEQASQEKKEVAKEPAIPEAQAKTYEKQTSDFFKDFHTFIFDDGNGNKVSIKFDEKQLKTLKEAVNTHIQNPASYEKGKIDNFDPQTLTSTFSWALYGSQMMKEALKQINTIASTIKAEQIAKQEPDKKGSADNGTVEGTAKEGDLNGQFQAMAEKKAKDRQLNPQKRPPLPAG